MTDHWAPPPPPTTTRHATAQSRRRSPAPIIAAAAIALVAGLAGGYAARLVTEPAPKPAATVLGCTNYLASQMRMALIHAESPQAWSEMNDVIIHGWRVNPEPECRGLTKAQNDEVGRQVLEIVGPDSAARIQQWTAAAVS